eukprot:m.15146 g.15146  ORF g.15146 m.15146 type:complete len:1016 (-) comp3415_c0_seq2:71-3118(-)
MAGLPELVQATNDSSILSKRSIAALGYIDDRHLPSFVARSARRAPLINRGYYIRSKAVDVALDAFLAECGDKPCQLVSLGAGFDTLYFRLADRGAWDRNPHLVVAEVDFPALVARKTALIAAAPVLNELVGDVAASPTADELGNGLVAPRYRLVGADLGDTANVEQLLQLAGVDPALPTLLLSECVLTYVDTTLATKVIGWSAGWFKQAMFVLYEQIFPADSFGVFMRKHFAKIGSPLQSLTTYPQLDDQLARFHSLGWSKVVAFDMTQLYDSILDASERERIENLELFDEFEEWHLKCYHYFVLLASNCDSLAPVPGKFEAAAAATNHLGGSGPALDAPSNAPVIRGSWTTVAGNGDLAPLARFGHAAATMHGRAYVFGGFGSENHARLNDLWVVSKSKSGLSAKPIPPPAGSPVPAARIHHTLTALESVGLVLFGGRQSPKRGYSDIWVFDPDLNEWTEQALADSAAGPGARWRHTACAVDTGIVVVGGRNQRALDCTPHFLQLADGKAIWSRLGAADGPQPPARHSHSATVDGGKMFVFGGLDAENRMLHDLWVFDLASQSWDELVLPTSLPPRFAHDTVWLPEQNCLLIVGGCGEGVLSWEQQFILVDVKSASWTFLGLPGKNELFQTLMLVSHRVCMLDSNVMTVLCGGGNCFSFGTKLNDPLGLVTLEPRSLRQALAVLRGGASLPPVMDVLSVLPEFEAGIVTRDVFEKQLYPQRIPMLFRGCAFGGASQTWTPEFLKSAIGDREVSTHVSSAERMDFTTRNFTFKVMSLSELVDSVFSPPEDDDQRYYLRSMGKNFRKDVSNISETFPELMETFKLPAFLPEEIGGDRLFSSALRIGSKGLQLWTHYDIMDNVLCNVIGRKRVVLWPPSEVENLYVEGATSQVVDIDNPDLERFPRFANTAATRIELILEPGDMLLLPALWFHNVLPLTPCISLNFFFRHLEPEMYQRKDLYGNKDLVPAAKALDAVEAQCAPLASLPPYYRDFYVRCAKARLQRVLDSPEPATQSQ